MPNCEFTLSSGQTDTDFSATVLQRHVRKHPLYVFFFPLFNKNAVKRVNF